MYVMIEKLNGKVVDKNYCARCRQANTEVDAFMFLHPEAEMVERGERVKIVARSLFDLRVFTCDWVPDEELF